MPETTGQKDETTMTTTNLATTCYLVLGCGESTIPAVREADNDPENWTLARITLAANVRDLDASKVTGERWCVLVQAEDVNTADLDCDRAVVMWHTVYDFALALGACAGIDPRDVAQCDAAIEAMREAGAIA